MSDSNDTLMNPAPASPALACCIQRRISVDAVATKERLDAWRAILGNAHDITVDPSRDFNASITSTAVESMLIHQMNSTAQASRRTAAMIRRDGMDHLVLHMCKTPISVRTAQGDSLIPAGTVSINDLSQSYSRSAAPERNSIILVLSRDLVSTAGGDLDNLHGTLLHDGAGAIFRAHMHALAQSASHITQDAASAAAHATAELLVACLKSTPDAVERARKPLEAAVLIRAKRFIESNLADQSLTPELVRQAVNVSRATLYRLFAPAGGVAGYIQERRLQLAHRRLLGRRSAETISAIGYECGFNGGAHLSRSFKQRFGRSPKDVVSTIRSPRLHADESAFIGEWLARFG